MAKKDELSHGYSLELKLEDARLFNKTYEYKVKRQTPPTCKLNASHEIIGIS